MQEAKKWKALFRKQSIPFFLLFLSSFFPILPEAVSSLAIIGFVISSFLLFGKSFSSNFKKYGFGPLLINAGFYITLILSCAYSSSPIEALSGMQASVSLLILPLVIIYVHPKISKPYFEAICMGYITSLLILFLYLFYVMLKGLTIDRFPNLMNESLFAQISAIGQYPYEFAISKAHKHLQVVYDTHKVYLSVNFAIGLFFALNLAKTFRAMVARVLFVSSALLFLLAIIYSQAIATLIAVGICIPSYFLLSMKSTRTRIVSIAAFLLLLFIGIGSGIFKTYENKNTKGIIKFLTVYFGNEPDQKKGMDKRYYIYDCAFDLATVQPLFGIGLGDVQPFLNTCYDSKQYTVAEYQSVGSQINTHNYYLHVMGASGIIGLFFLGFLFTGTFKLAFKKSDYLYAAFLLIFFLGLLFENLLIRMMGVFPFAIFNSLLFSKNMIAKDES